MNNDNSSLEIANVERKEEYPTEKNKNDVSMINEDLADEETKIDFQNDNEHCQEEFAWPFCWPKTRIGTRIRIPCGTTTGNQSETQLERYCGSNGVWQEELLATNSNETE